MGSAGLIDPVTTIVHCGVSLWDDPESLESRSRLLERQDYIDTQTPAKGCEHLKSCTK